MFSGLTEKFEATYSKTFDSRANWLIALELSLQRVSRAELFFLSENGHCTPHSFLYYKSQGRKRYKHENCLKRLCLHRSISKGDKYDLVNKTGFLLI